MFTQFIINGIINGAIYGLVALGFALVYNTTRIFHIAYSALYIIAPYMLLFFMNSIGLPMYLSVISAVVITMGIGLATDVLVYRPVEKRSGSSNTVMLASIGVMIVLINVVALVFGNETKIINSDISATVSYGNVLITHTQILQFLVSVAMITGFMIFLKYSRFGIYTRAYRDNRLLAEVHGINTQRLRTQLFLLSSLFVASGSCLVAYDVGMNPYTGMPLLLNAVVALIIGGIGRFEAPVIGGIILGILQSMVVYLTSARWQEAVTFVVLILFILLRPQGIMGDKNRSV